MHVLYQNNKTLNADTIIEFLTKIDKETKARFI